MLSKLREHYNKTKGIKTRIDELERENTILHEAQHQAPTVPTVPHQKVKVKEEPTKAHPCEFYRFDSANDKVHCSRDFAKKGVIHRVTKDLCNKCWEAQNPEREANKQAHELFFQSMTGNQPFKNYPCPYNARRTDSNLQLVFCGRRLTKGGLITERQVKYWQIKTVGRCKQCIEIHEKAEQLREIAQKDKARNRELNKMPRVDWGKSEGARQW